MSDLIDRKTVFDVIDKCILEKLEGDTVEIKESLKLITKIYRIPSAQPVNYGSTKSDSSSQLKLNNDLISRQDVLKILSSKNAAWDAYDKVKRLPSAQPQRKTGKWIKLYAGNYKCSVCGDWWGNDNNEMVEDFKYCPNCGARMDGESDE